MLRCDTQGKDHLKKKHKEDKRKEKRKEKKAKKKEQKKKEERKEKHQQGLIVIGLILRFLNKHLIILVILVILDGQEGE